MHSTWNKNWKKIEWIKFYLVHLWKKYADTRYPIENMWSNFLSYSSNCTICFFFRFMRTLHDFILYEANQYIMKFFCFIVFASTKQLHCTRRKLMLFHKSRHFFYSVLFPLSMIFLHSYVINEVKVFELLDIL